MRISALLLSAAALWGAGGSAASAAECVGNCGTTLGADGVVSTPPNSSGRFDWISTNAGQFGAGQLPIGGVNGSQLTSTSFHAAAGSKIEFFFNYVTSDGAGFADYGWARLIGGSAAPVTLFTARTRPDGVVVPGFQLPDVNATLTPTDIFIQDGLTTWSALGGSSGDCFAQGCGMTGWIKSSYEVDTAGSYQLVFGVSNWGDSAFDSGMAFSGLVVDGTIIGDGRTPESPLAPSDLIDGTGAFVFEFTPTPNETVFIDPDYATGYDYSILTGENSILSAIFPVLSGDDGFYTLSYGSTIEQVAAGVMYTFAMPVQSFSLTGIDLAAMVDPTNPAGFVTGLNFATGNAVTLSQLPTGIVSVGEVPEPATWLMLILGFGVVGAGQRLKRPRHADHKARA